LRFKRVDNLGAYTIPSETGLLIPSVAVEISLVTTVRNFKEAKEA